MVNLFGKGFIGTHYASSYDCIVNERNDLVPKTNSILYFISTTDNYNVTVNPFIDIETNLITLIRVLENCRNIKDVVFNFSSSWFVYGNKQTEVDETSYCEPQGFYSITKRTAEQLLMSYCKTYGIKYRILRFGNVIGVYDKFSAKKNALTYVIDNIVHNRDVHLYDGGNFFRDYIGVVDLCNAINLVITKGEINSIYNIGSGVKTKFSDLVEYALEKTKSQSNILNITTNQTYSFSMSCDKLKSLGFVATQSINSIIDEIIVHCKNR